MIRLHRFAGWLFGLPLRKRVGWGMAMCILNHILTGALIEALRFGHLRMGWFPGSDEFINYTAVGQFLRSWWLLLISYPAIIAIHYGFTRRRHGPSLAIALTLIAMTLAVSYGIHAVGSISNVAMLMYPLMAVLTTLLVGTRWGIFAFALGLALHVGVLLMETSGAWEYAPVFLVLDKESLVHPAYMMTSLAWLALCSALFLMVTAVLFQRNAEEIQRRNAELTGRISTLVDRSPLAVLVVEDDRISYANEAASRLAGIPPGQSIAGRSLSSQIVQASEFHAAQMSVNGELPDDWKRIMRFGWRRDNGEVVGVEATAVRSRDMPPRSFHCVLRNLTEEEQSEREKLAIWGSQIGLWDWDMESHKVLWNDSREDPGGLAALKVQPEEEWIGMVHPGDFSRFAEALEKYETGRVPLFECDCRIRMGASDWRWVHLRGKAVQYGPGRRPQRMVGTQLDITARISMEAELLKARNMEAVARLAGGVAHDLNNMLTPIMAESELLSLEFPAHARMTKGLESIRNAAVQARSLVAQLLAFAQKQPLNPRSICIGPFLEDLLPALRSLLGREIEISLQTGESVPAFTADPANLRQIVLNLCSNAREAMPKGGSLEITAFLAMRPCAGQVPGISVPHVGLVVKDTGEGIPADLLPHLFEPFFTTKSKDIGKGLGLASCYGLIRQMNGEIYVKSEVGKGSTFEVYWPVTAGCSEDGFGPS